MKTMDVKHLDSIEILEITRKKKTNKQKWNEKISSKMKLKKKTLVKMKSIKD